MRIFLAGATGVIGVRLVPLLVAAGHEVVGMTRSAARFDALRDLGAEPVACDVYDADALASAVAAASADLVMHQLTDLPDDAALLPERRTANARIRTEGTANLLAAAAAAGVRRIVAQSIAWRTADHAPVERHERMVLDAGGVVVRYGQFHGPGTYYPDEPPAPPRISIDAAARRTLEVLDAPSGIVTLVDPD